MPQHAPGRFWNQEPFALWVMISFSYNAHNIITLIHLRKNPLGCHWAQGGGKEVDGWRQGGARTADGSAEKRAKMRGIATQ